MLDVIVIVRLHAMYRSRKVLVFLVIVFMTVTIACGLVSGIVGRDFSYDEFILSGTYQCVSEVSQPSDSLIMGTTWIFYMAWAILGMSLAAWAAFRHFREIKQWTAKDRLTALVKSHMIYFTILATACCLSLGLLSPKIPSFLSMKGDIYYGVIEIILFVQMFLLGPYLILSIRKYNNDLTATSDAGIGIQLLPRSVTTTRRLTVMYDAVGERHVSGTLHEV